MANPAASQHVTSAADVMQIVRGLAPGITAFPIRIHRPNDNHDVPATVKLRDKLKPVVAIRGHSRDVALDNMLSTAMKVKGDPCSQTSPAPALSPTSATVPTPTPAPATAPLPPPPPTPPQQPPSPPAIPAAAAKPPQRKTPKPRKKESATAPLLTLIALMAVVIGVLLGWLLISNQSNNDTGGVSTKQQPQTAMSATHSQPAGTQAIEVSKPPTAPTLLIEDYSTNLGDGSFEIAGTPERAIEVVPPDDWRSWKKTCVANCGAGEGVAFKLLGSEEFGGFYPADAIPDFGSNLEPRAPGKNTKWQMKFVCPGATCPVIRFIKEE